MLREVRKHSAKAPAGGITSTPHLHLVTKQGLAVAPEVRSSIEFSYRSILHDYPHVDPALIATWAEEIAVSMDAKADIAHFDGYALISLGRKVRGWLRSGAGKETPSGIGGDLDLAGGHIDGVTNTTSALLFSQLLAMLEGRDRVIFHVLFGLDGSASDVASAVGISEAAAHKAIQRLRKRLAMAVRRTKIMEVISEAPKGTLEAPISKKWTRGRRSLKRLPLRLFGE
jgi:hypothetical protein